MAEPFMSPRSYAYSGGDLSPYRERPDFGSTPGVAMGTEPQATATPQGGGGFLAGLERFAGAINPIVDAAVAFKRGYDTGLPLPGRFGGNRMAGQEFIFQALEDMRARNERASEEASREREVARKQDLKTQILLKAYENKEISLQDLMQSIESGDLALPEASEKLPSQEPVTTSNPETKPAPTPSVPAVSESPADTRTSAGRPTVRYGNEAISPDFRGYI